MRIIIILLLTSLVSVGYGQSKSKLNKKRRSTLEKSGNSRDPYTQTADRATTKKKSTKKKDGATSYDAQHEYYARVADNQKKREQNERMLDKPQYSDPMYFGHKRPPKKRKAGKMKFCKECGIKH